ncbi:MAG: hypothetical protein ACOCUT_03400 [bacterium]
MKKQEIKKIEMADRYGEEDTTVSITVSSNNKEETFHVQTVDNEYRPDLGCWIVVDDEDGDIDIDDYPDFDIQEIIKKAEEFIQAEVKEEPTNYQIDGEWVYLKIYRNKVEAVAKNSEFINKVHSTYQREFSDPIETFMDREDAIDYLESLEVNKQQSLEP